MIEVRVGTRNLSQMLREIQRRAGDLRPALTKIGEEMIDATQENFDREGRPKWLDLASSTKKRREAKGKSGKMLQVTGQLINSISRTITGASAIVGTNLKYAEAHQFGGWYGRNRQTPIPARPFLKLTKRDVEGAEKILVKYLQGLG